MSGTTILQNQCQVIRLVTALLLLLCSFQIAAHVHSLARISNYVPNAQKVGESKLKIFIWSLYDVYLYAPGGQWSPDVPHALGFEYKRAFSTEELVVNAVDQMRKYQNVDELRLAAWYNKMSEFIPDVEKGDLLQIIASDDMQTIFYYHSIKTEDFVESGRIRDPSFTQYFFKIWLGENVEHQEVKEELLAIEK